MTDSLETKVRSLVATVLNLPEEKVKADSSRETLLGWDSMAIIQMMVSVETEFDVMLDVDEAALLTSVPNIVQLVEKKKTN